MRIIKVIYRTARTSVPFYLVLSMLVSLSLLPKPLVNLSILRRLPSNGADKGCDGVRQIGSIHVQRLWKGYRFGLTTDRIFWQGSARVRCDEMVPFRLFSSQGEPDWFSGGYSRCYFAEGVCNFFFFVVIYGEVNNKWWI